MLGHIFENLLEDNKDKGAYYTPKAIVSYMARQSLLHYLQTHLGEDPELALLLNEKDLTRLEKDGFVHRHAARIAGLLDEVKVCDPAIGSGAFPIGVLQEILWTRLTLNWELNTPEERARLKRRIIQNSIHGVDIDPGAVEIARLRFWLALVVDEDQPRPLPNLDYKIHRADSLIEYIRGEPVHLGKVSAEDRRTHGAIQSLIAAKAALFGAQKLPEKRAARFALYRALAEVAMAEFTWLRNDMGLIANDAERAAQVAFGLKEFGHRLKLIDGAAKESAKMQDRVLAELRDWFDDEEKPTFLWQLHFGEVFARGGFDIVIANPPYVRQEVIRPIKPMLKERFQCFKGTADIFVYFYERAENLLKVDGTLTFITSNKFHRTAYGNKLRGFLSRSLTVRTLIDFGDKPIFDAIAYASILIASKRQPNAHSGPISYTWKETDNLSLLSQILCDRGFFIQQEKLTEDGWRLERSDALNLLAKIRGTGTPLRQIVGSQSYRGVTTGLNDAFIINDETRRDLIRSDPNSAKVIKSYLRGKDIKRWTADSAGLFLIFTRQGIDISKFPAIKKHLSQFRNKLEPKPATYASASKWEGRKEGNYNWFEIQDQTAYWPELEKRKIVSTKVSITPTFMIDKSESYLGNTSYSIAIDDAHTYLVTILNSLVSFFYCKKVFVDKESGWFEIQPDGLEAFPIPPASPADKARLSQLAEACAAAAQRGDDETLAVHEAEIDEIVYRLFDLTSDEIALIESSLAATRSAKPGRGRQPKGIRAAKGRPPAGDL